MTKPKYKPILFAAPMVMAILEGRKTQTRMIMKTQPGEHWEPYSYCDIHKMRDGEFVMRHGEPVVIGYGPSNFDGDEGYPCPYGQPGDRLWVREKFKTAHDEDNLGDCIEYADGTKIKPVVPDNHTGFRFSWDCDNDNVRWRPAIHMPRWASRINLEITGVRVERVQDISEDDAIAEGRESQIVGYGWNKYIPNSHDDVRRLTMISAKMSYGILWRSIHGPDSWDKNPWVWVIEFKRVEG